MQSAFPRAAAISSQKCQLLCRLARNQVPAADFAIFTATTRTAASPLKEQPRPAITATAADSTRQSDRLKRSQHSSDAAQRTSSQATERSPQRLPAQRETVIPAKYGQLHSPTQLAMKAQWWSNCETQWLQYLQWEESGGLTSLQVLQQRQLSIRLFDSLLRFAQSRSAYQGQSCRPWTMPAGVVQLRTPKPQPSRPKRKAMTIFSQGRGSLGAAHPAKRSAPKAQLSRQYARTCQWPGYPRKMLRMTRVLEEGGIMQIIMSVYSYASELRHVQRRPDQLRVLQRDLLHRTKLKSEGKQNRQSPKTPSRRYCIRPLPLAPRRDQLPLLRQSLTKRFESVGKRPCFSFESSTSKNTRKRHFGGRRFRARVVQVLCLVRIRRLIKESLGFKIKWVRARFQSISYQTTNGLLKRLAKQLDPELRQICREAKEELAPEAVRTIVGAVVGSLAQFSPSHSELELLSLFSTSKAPFLPEVLTRFQYERLNLMQEMPLLVEVSGRQTRMAILVFLLLRLALKYLLLQPWKACREPRRQLPGLRLLCSVFYQLVMWPFLCMRKVTHHKSYEEEHQLAIRDSLEEDSGGSLVAGVDSSMGRRFIEANHFWSREMTQQLEDWAAGIERRARVCGEERSRTLSQQFFRFR